MDTLVIKLMDDMTFFPSAIEASMKRPIHQNDCSYMKCSNYVCLKLKEAKTKSNGHFSEFPPLSSLPPLYSHPNTKGE